MESDPALRRPLAAEFRRGPQDRIAASQNKSQGMFFLLILCGIVATIAAGILVRAGRRSAQRYSMDMPQRFHAGVLRSPSPPHLFHNQERAQVEEVGLPAARGAGRADLPVHI